jgi:Methylamine utilisation protein MauE
MRSFCLWLLASMAMALWSPTAALAQCGNCGCPAGQDCYCGLEYELGYCYCVPGTPIIIALNGQFTLTNSAQGVEFNFFLNGPVQIAWTAPRADEGWLVLPPKGSSTIDNGAEMFGNLTPQPTSNDPNGFLALAVYDDPSNGGNGNGVIDSGDAIFPRLRIWQDSNHNGISEPWELLTLQEAGITSISLSYAESGHVDRWGNRFRYRSKVVSTNSADRWAYDVFLQFTKPTTTSDLRNTIPDGDPVQSAAAGLHAHGLATGSFLILWSRALIGLLLTAAAILKMMDFQSFRAAIRGFALIPEGMTLPVAYFLVVLEALTGQLTLAAVLFNSAVPHWGAMIAAILFFAFGVAIAINLIRGRRDIACGCFTTADTEGISWFLVVRNGALCVIALLGFQPVQSASWLEYGSGTQRLGILLLATFTLLACTLVFAVRRLWQYGREFSPERGVE